MHAGVFGLEDGASRWRVATCRRSHRRRAYFRIRWCGAPGTGRRRPDRRHRREVPNQRESVMRIAIVGAGVAGCIVARTLSRLGGADTKYVNSIDVAETEDGSASSPPPL